MWWSSYIWERNQHTQITFAVELNSLHQENACCDSVHILLPSPLVCKNARFTCKTHTTTILYVSLFCVRENLDFINWGKMRRWKVSANKIIRIIFVPNKEKEVHERWGTTRKVEIHKLTRNRSYYEIFSQSVCVKQLTLLHYSQNHLTCASLWL